MQNNSEWVVCGASAFGNWSRKPHFHRTAVSLGISKNLIIFLFVDGYSKPCNSISSEGHKKNLIKLFHQNLFSIGLNFASSWRSVEKAARDAPAFFAMEEFSPSLFFFYSQTQQFPPPGRTRCCRTRARGKMPYKVQNIPASGQQNNQ